PPVHLAAVMRDPRVWQVAALFTFQNLVYYTVATWVPFLLVGRSAGYVATTFLSLNFFPIVPLFPLSFVRWPSALSPPYHLVAGLMSIRCGVAPASRAARVGATSTLQPKPTDWRPRAGSFPPREWRDWRRAGESVACAGSTASHAATPSAPRW